MLYTDRQTQKKLYGNKIYVLVNASFMILKDFHKRPT